MQERAISYYRYTYLAMMAMAILCIAEWARMPTAHTAIVHFFNVGQGDGALIVRPSGQQIVVDGGPNLSLLSHLGETMPFFDRTIDWLILTHPHLDHVAAFPELLRRYRVGNVLMSAAAYDNGRYQEFLSVLRQQRTPIVIADPTQDISFDDGLTLDVLWPPPVYFGKTTKDIHDTTVVFRMTYGTGSVLFMGDAERSVEQKLMDADLPLKSDVLKVGHHGSKTSSSSGFLLAVNPRLSVISVGARNKYGLPSPVILRRFQSFHLPYQTTMSGTIVVRIPR